MIFLINVAKSTSPMDPSWVSYSPVTNLSPKTNSWPSGTFFCCGFLAVLVSCESSKTPGDAEKNPHQTSWIWMNFHHKSTTKLDFKHPEMLRHLFKSISFMFKSYMSRGISSLVTSLRLYIIPYQKYAKSTCLEHMVFPIPFFIGSQKVLNDV